MVGDEVPQKWIDISSKIKIPFDDANQIHLEFDGYEGQKIKQVVFFLLLILDQLILNILSGRRHLAWLSAELSND